MQLGVPDPGGEAHVDGPAVGVHLREGQLGEDPQPQGDLPGRELRRKAPQLAETQPQGAGAG